MGEGWRYARPERVVCKRVGSEGKALMDTMDRTEQDSRGPSENMHN